MQNIGSSLKLKGMKKVQKSRVAYTHKLNEKTEMQKFGQQLQQIMPPSEQRDLAMEATAKKLKEYDEELRSLSDKVDQAQRVYNRQISTATRIIPELSAFIYVNPHLLGVDPEEPETPENVNFYN